MSSAWDLLYLEYKQKKWVKILFIKIHLSLNLVMKSILYG